MACSDVYVDYFPTDERLTDERSLFETTERRLTERGVNLIFRYISNGMWDGTMGVNTGIKYREIARTPYFIEIEIEARFIEKGGTERHKLYANRDEITFTNGTAVARGHWVK